jgi:hypothetical protein
MGDFQVPEIHIVRFCASIFCSNLSLVMILRGLGKSIALSWAMIEERNLKFKDHRLILREV